MIPKQMKKNQKDMMKKKKMKAKEIVEKVMKKKMKWFKTEKKMMTD